MNRDEYLNPTQHPPPSTPEQQLHPHLPAPNSPEPPPPPPRTSQPPSPTASSLHAATPIEFPQGEEPLSTPSTARNVSLASRIGSTGSQILHPINEVRKRTGRRVLHRPGPLDLDQSKLQGKGQPALTPGTHAGSISGSDSRASSFLGVGTGPGSGMGFSAISGTKSRQRGPKFPKLKIKTDLAQSDSDRRTAPSPPPVTAATHQGNNSIHQSAAAASAHNNSLLGRVSSINQNEGANKTPSTWQTGLERMLKKIQRRKRAPSNLIWYATHSTEAYLSGAIKNVSEDVMKNVDAEAESLYFGKDKPPRWVVDTLQGQNTFFNDDTVELVLGLRDYLIQATQSGWDILELKEEFTGPRSAFIGRRNRSNSPHGSPRRTSFGNHPSSPTSPTMGPHGSPTSSRRSSTGSLEYDLFSQQMADRYQEEETTCRLLDYFLSILSDIISHDCRYKVQNPRPSRPEWILHTLVLDVLYYLAKNLVQDHKAIYDIGMIALSAFSVFQNNSLVRLLDLLTEHILPSFALSRTHHFTSAMKSPPLSPININNNPGSPKSPSAIHVQLNNNQTFAIQVHSPKDEQVPPAGPQLNRPSLTSPRGAPSSRSSSTSFLRASGPTTLAQNVMDTHATSLISLTLLAVLQQISFSKSPLPVAKQVQKSIGGLLRIKPDLAVDLLEVIAIVENEKVMRRALEVLWWVCKPTLGHLILSEKFFPLDYESILLMRQTKQEQEWGAIRSLTTTTTGQTRTNAMFSSFRRGSMDEYALLPRHDHTARNNSTGSVKSKTRRVYRPSLPWKASHGQEALPMNNIPQPTTAGLPAGTDYLIEHELYPYMFRTLDTADNDLSRDHTCERCELVLKGYGLYCYHCRGSIHLECFYSIKRFAGVDCMQLGGALDLVSRRPRNQLIYPEESGIYEDLTNRTFRIRSGHHLQLVNLFSTCLCAACKLPLWGHHYQGYRCHDCSQLMHLDCPGIISTCGTITQPLAIRNSFPTRIGYQELRQSFKNFYQNLIATYEACQSAPAAAAGSGPSVAPDDPGAAAAATRLPDKDRYSYEEASCNASALTLQLELFRAGISRGEIQVQEWISTGEGGRSADGDGSESESGFELYTLQKYFMDLTLLLQVLGSTTTTSTSTASALNNPSNFFLSDFFEDTKPEQFLLFSEAYWSHLAAMTKIMLSESDMDQQQFYRRQQQANGIGGAREDAVTMQEEDIFAIGLDPTQEKLLARHSVQTDTSPLATIFRFCMRQLGFQSTWSMQLILQEWVKLGLLERLDGELYLFERIEPVDSNTIQLPPPIQQLTPSISDRTSTSAASNTTSSYGSLMGIRSVPCHFPIITAIDRTAQVENLIHAIWRCLSSLDLSINECGFLLLTRQAWPDPFMSDYTAERLLGAVFHWLLLEDEQLSVIHKNYTTRGKGIPGVRNGLEEQLARKLIVLTGGTVVPGVPNSIPGTPGASLSAPPPLQSVAPDSANATASAVLSGAGGGGTPLNDTNGGVPPPPPSIATAAAAAAASAAANARNSSVTSNLFGEVGSFVRTRKLMLKKFALPWLKKVMEMDGDRYLEMVYRQIRVLEREMAPEDDACDGESETLEEQRKTFQHTQVERYLDSITKLRHAGFLFATFPNVLSRWLENVEELLEGMDLSSKSFKTLNRLFLKSSLGNSNGDAGRTASGLGVANAMSGQSTPGSSSRADSEWRHRLKAKLHVAKGFHLHHQNKGQAGGGGFGGLNSDATHNMDPTADPVSSRTLFDHTATAVLEDLGENPLGSMQMILKSNQKRGRSQGVEKALYWLDLMVLSGIVIPTQAFVDCGHAIVETSHTPTLVPVDQKDSRAVYQHVLDLSGKFLRTCWEYIVGSPQRIAEAEAEELLELVLGASKGSLLKLGSMRLKDAVPETLDSARQLLKYAYAIMLYVYGCPIYAIIALGIAPVVAGSKSSASHAPGFLPLMRQAHHRQQYQSLQPLALDRESLPVVMLLNGLSSQALSLQGEVAKGLAMMIDQAGRVSNMDAFLESIHQEVIPGLWELLSPLNDHMIDTTLFLLLRFISLRPAFFHKTVSRSFTNQNWEIRFSSLDSAFGLFSKLDDATVMKLFFQQSVPIATHIPRHNTKGKGFERGGTTRTMTDSGSSGGGGVQHQRQKPNMFDAHNPIATTMPGGFPIGGSTLHTNTMRSDNSRTGTGLGIGQTGSTPSQPFQSFTPAAGFDRFSIDELALLGPVFGHFVTCMWDKEDAVRTKAKALLKSLQPVQVGHALKAWEMHFVVSAPDVQQQLLKVMTRMNNFFPNWKIMDYKLIFKLLTSGNLGRVNGNGSNSSLRSRGSAGDMNGLGEEEPPGGKTSSEGCSATLGKAFKAKDRAVSRDSDGTSTRQRRASFASLPRLEYSSGLFQPATAAAFAAADPARRSRRASFVGLIRPDGIPVPPPPPPVAPTAAQTSRLSQRRASAVFSVNTLSSGSTSSVNSIVGDSEAREKQLALEDDIHCSLLNLALQMVANGIEPRLEEVIQLKYLVVFYLDFEGCELVNMGHNKQQVRYGEYIPRQRVSPLAGGGVLNDPGHENFVQAICNNLQLILDRYVEIKPEEEHDPPKLYDQFARKGGRYAELVGPSSTGARTFTATTTTTLDMAKDSSRTGTGLGGVDTAADTMGPETPPRSIGFFCFPWNRHQNDSASNGDDSQGSPTTHSSHAQEAQAYYQQNPTNQYQYHTQNSRHHAAPLHQQHHHHHYRRNRQRRHDENDPVVGTFFVDVILRFFGSETDLSILPATRLKSWLELLLIVIYKYVKEQDIQLQDLVTVLMKRIVEMLMVKRGGPSSTNTANTAGTTASSAPGSSIPATGGMATGGVGRASTSAAVTGDESMSEGNILLAISICSTLLNRSSTMTTALLSREIMAMGKLMTKRRDDPDDPILIKARNFLHDAFVHFMGSGLFVLVFKTQPALTMNASGWIEEAEMDQDLDLFYVLATVLGENEMVPPDPTSSTGGGAPGASSSNANSRLVHIRDQPVRDIVDRVMIIKHLDPPQVSNVLSNLALYIERVHSKFTDLHLLPDMAIFLIKVTKYTAEWDQNQVNKQKEQLRQAQDQQQQEHLRQQFRRQDSQFSSVQGGRGGVRTPQSTTIMSGRQYQKKQGVTSMTSGTTAATMLDHGHREISPPPGSITANATTGMNQVMLPPGLRHTMSDDTQVTQVAGQMAATTMSSVSTSSGTNIHPFDQPTLAVQAQSGVTPPVPTATGKERRKSVTLKTMNSTDVDSSLFPQYRKARPSTPTLIGGGGGGEGGGGNSIHPFAMSNSATYPLLPPAQRRGHAQHWNYVNPLLGLCSTLMIQNPMEAQCLLGAVKHILKQSLYRDNISAASLIRLCTGYCYMAELNFALPLVNAFGQFVVEELKSSIFNRGEKGGGGVGNEDGEDENDGHEDGTGSNRKYSKFWAIGGKGDDFDLNLSNAGKEYKKKEKDSRASADGGGFKGGKISLGIGGIAGVGGGGGQAPLYHGHGNNAGGRTKILASNFRMLHHLLQWDLDPSYNMEWTRIKWDILGNMRFPPGHPILFPGANDGLRQATGTIIGDLVDA